MRFAILGNSGSGKSTLALALARRQGVPLLDLDSVAWVPEKVGVARDAMEAIAEVRSFCSRNDSFVIEGCYEDLIAVALPYQPRLVFLDLPFEVCEQHCRARPFEPHKYSTVEAQNEKLEVLLAWVREYYSRTGRMSRTEHVKLFEAYAGPKTRVVDEIALGTGSKLIQAG